MRYWTRRFTLRFLEFGHAWNTSDNEINRDVLHANIRGILLAGTSGWTSIEFVSLLATSGTTGAEGESSGNSCELSHFVDAVSTLCGDAALAARDAQAGKN